MYSYIVRRLLFIPVTLFVILLINFSVAQFTPGGPVEQYLAKLHHFGEDALSRVSGTSQNDVTEKRKDRTESGNPYRGSQGLDEDYIRELEKAFGFDKPPQERFWKMLKDYLRFDFGKSYFTDKTVVELIVEKLPVSITLGFWTTLLIYLISIPLGIVKAVRDGSRFDIWTSAIVIIGYAVPGFLFAILLVVLFAGGSFLDWFPLRGLHSPNWEEMGFFARIGDYFWHITLPVLSMVIGGFATLTLLTKNSFLEEINKLYVKTAKAKGLSTRRVLYGHVFRNAMIIVIAGFPAAFVDIFFTGSLLIEVIFSLDGIGLLGYSSVIQRDYPVVFATLYMFGLLGLLLNLVSDLTYHFVDPRIDFENREV